MLKQRLLNYGTIVSLISFIFSTLIMAGVIPVPLADAVKTLIVSFLNLLVVAGILNNPASGKGFSDEISKEVEQVAKELAAQPVAEQTVAQQVAAQPAQPAQPVA